MAVQFLKEFVNDLLSHCVFPKIMKIVLWDSARNVLMKSELWIIYLL